MQLLNTILRIWYCHCVLRKQVLYNWKTTILRCRIIPVYYANKLNAIVKSPPYVGTFFDVRHGYRRLFFFEKMQKWRAAAIPKPVKRYNFTGALQNSKTNKHQCFEQHQEWK